MTDPAGWILVPGFSQAPSVWQAVADRIGGATMPTVPAGCDFDTAADRLAAENGRGRWAGYSMGGRLALKVAIEHPDLVDHLVLVSATAGIRDPDERARRRVSDADLADSIERHGVDRFLERWVANPLFVGADPAALRAHRMTSAPAIADQLRRLGQGAQHPLWERLGEITCPVTVVAGGRDTAYSAAAMALAAAIPGAELEIIPDAGHALLIEQPEQVADLLADRA